MNAKTVAGVLLLALTTSASGLPREVQVRAVIPAGNPCPGNLVVELNLFGKDLKEIKGLRCIVDKAIDDTGKNLLLEAPDFTKTNQTWTPLVYDPRTPPGMQLLLDLPAQQATKVQELSGRLEILTPVHDPLCVLTFTPIATLLDVELANPYLRAAQVKMTVSTNSNPSVAVRVHDPLSKLFYFEILDADGKEWDAVSSTMTAGNTTTHTYPGPLPKNATLRVCVPTPKSIITVPLNLKHVTLPPKKE